MYARRPVFAFFAFFAAAATTTFAHAAEPQRDVLLVDVIVEAVAPDLELSAASLRNLVTGRLRLERGIFVVASRDEQVKLVELKRRSYEPRFDDALQAELGRDLSANVLLRVAIRDALPRHLLELELVSLRESAILASSVVEWTPLSARSSVDRAVGGLLAQLARPLPAVESALPVDELDVQSFLDDPRTSLLAIVPHTATSTRTDRGLRIVKSVLAEKYYLWSWRGDLLVDGGSAGDLERAIEREHAKRPYVHLLVHPASSTAHFLRALEVSTRLSLEGVKAADYLLEISITSTSARAPRVELKLLSLDRAELLAAAVHESCSADRAIAALFDAMRRPADRSPLTPLQAEIERAWRELYPVVVDGELDRARRLAAVDTFLRKFPEKNHRRRQAELIRAAIEE